MKPVREILIALVALCCCTGPSIAQPRRDMTPTVLKGPADWRFEKMPTPPMFAPDIKLSGYEEARFAPGMFDNTSTNYFTYVLIVSADGAPEIDGPALKDFLEKYYRGLSVGLGQRKGMKPDPAQMVAEVSPGAEGRSNATVTFFDSFTDGRKIKLNVEARVVPRPGVKKTGLVLLISPQPKSHEVWRKLHEIEGSIDFGG
jgi:hypothetical protein